MPPKKVRETESSTTAPRNMLLDAALQVFVRRGYERTSMDVVADAAKGARRTAYYQFPEGKESLFRMVVARVWTRFPVLDIMSSPEAIADPEVGLRRIGAAVAEFWAPPLSVGLLRMAIAEGPRFPDLTKSFFEAGKAPAMRAVTKYITGFAERGISNVDDPELASRQFFGLVNEPLLWPRVVGIGDTPKLPTGRKPSRQRSICFSITPGVSPSFSEG